MSGPGAPQGAEPIAPTTARPGGQVKVRRARWFDESDQKSAKAYLASMVALPVAVFVFLVHPLGLSKLIYGPLVTLAAWPPTDVSWRVLGDRSRYSWLALKAQVWCLFGGATRQALRCIRSSNPQQVTEHSLIAEPGQRVEPTLPGPATQQGPPRVRPWRYGLVVVGLIVVTCAVIVGVTAAIRAAAGPRMIDVHGRFTLTDLEAIASDGPLIEPAHAGATGPCRGVDGDDDITAGARVVISDARGKTVATTQLGRGEFDPSGSCTFTFTARVRSYGHSYGVTVTHRGTVTFPRADIAYPELVLGG